MKSGGLPLAFGLSLLAHSMVVSTILLIRSGMQAVRLRGGDSDFTITLIAGRTVPENYFLPATESVVRTAPLVEETPIPPQPEPPPPEPIREPEPAKPIIAFPEPIELPAPELIQPTAPAPPPRSEPVVSGAPSTSAPNPVNGDASSLRPGLDVTTIQANVGSRAYPSYRKNPEPLYPLAAKRRHQQGEVLLSVRVTVQGRASSVQVKQSSGFALLDEAAVQAVTNWEFDPARVNLTPAESEVEVPVRFTLGK